MDQARIAEILSLVRRYGLARILANAATPTRRQRGHPAIEATHAGYLADAEALFGRIEAALRGTPAEDPQEQ